MLLSSLSTCLSRSFFLFRCCRAPCLLPCFFLVLADFISFIPLVSKYAFLFSKRSMVVSICCFPAITPFPRPPCSALMINDVYGKIKLCALVFLNVCFQTLVTIHTIQTSKEKLTWTRKNSYKQN